MTRLGGSPPAVCHCGHPAADHHMTYGRCDADVDRPEVGRTFGCFCPHFDLDGDR